MMNKSSKKMKQSNKSKRRIILRLKGDKVCSQALQIIQFLGTLYIQKLDLKYKPRLRRIPFFEWMSQLEIGFSSNKYTIKVQKDYSTKNRIYEEKSKQVDSLVYTATYTFMKKTTKGSFITYTNQEAK